MRLIRFRTLFTLLLTLAALVVMTQMVSAQPAGQDVVPTTPVPMATVTSTAGGPIITVRADTENAQINVRSGPGTEYERVGTLLVGQTAPAKGKTSGGRWILIEYHGVQGGEGWVYASLVTLSPGALPVVEPPPTPTPATTNTIDPTMAARFVITQASTPLPTYTEPAPLVVPTFEMVIEARSSGIPIGLVILTLGGLGILIGLFSIAQSR